MTDASMPWDPSSLVSAGFSVLGNDKKWAEKHWLNVPGPFYTGQTDNCWTGRLHAPRHVLYGGEYYNEFVYRQPKSREEEVEAAEGARDFLAYLGGGELERDLRAYVIRLEG